MSRSVKLWAISTLFLFHGLLTAQEELVVGLQPDGSVVTPTHQILRPAGLQILFPGRPVDLALSPDGKWLAAQNKSSLVLIRVRDRTVMQTLDLPKGGMSFKGIAFSTDGSRIYVSEANRSVYVAAMEDGVLRWVDHIDFPGPNGAGDASAPGGLTLSPDGHQLYVCLSRNNSLAAVDLRTKETVTIPVGVAPYDVLLSHDGRLAYVSNWGGRPPKKGEPASITSGSPILVNPRTGIASSGTVSIVDLKTGKEITQIEVGLHPCGMALSATGARLFVACANSDLVYVIDTDSRRVVERINVRMDPSLPFGSAPNALAVTKDGTRLFVANGTDNALAVVELGYYAGNERASGFQSYVAGFIPTGWYPGAVLLDDADQFLFVANVKGLGSLNPVTWRGGHNSHDHLGSISVVRVPDRTLLARYTDTVRRNNGFPRLASGKASPEGKRKRRVPIPMAPEEESVFKHVIYIIKENRTYDQVFGDLPQGDGDSSLVHFGREVTPNHHALAEQFVLLDNYYCCGVLSADGHQWTDEAYVTDYIEKQFGDFARSYPYDGGDALAYASSGFIWDHVLAHGFTFRDYGEFVEAHIEPQGEFLDIYRDFVEGTGKFKIWATPKLETLKPYICPRYIGFPNSVPDVYRAQVFIDELKKFEKKGELPNFIIMLLPNDHTSGLRPGRPTPRAAVADNDLALGRIVEAVSHSRFWKETLILVTEDDPQAGLDHVDGHRTVGLVISPYTKRGAVIHTYYTQISMVRTIEQVFGIPPMNQFDLAAEPMVDCFTETPDFTPYTALPNNIPLDEVNPPLGELEGEARYWAERSLELDLEDVDRAEEDLFNRILWFACKGPGVPYPTDVGRAEKGNSMPSCVRGDGSQDPE